MDHFHFPSANPISSWSLISIVSDRETAARTTHVLHNPSIGPLVPNTPMLDNWV